MMNKSHNRYKIWLTAACAISFTWGGVFYLVSQTNKAVNCNLCISNIATIRALLRGYEQANGSFPPIAIYDESGIPLHSWRILLARLEMPEEFAGYDMNESWDGPNNRTYISKIPRFFRCKNESRSSSKQFETSYVCIKSGHSFVGLPVSPDGEVSISEATRIPLMIVEMADSGIPWTQPVDLDVKSMSFEINDFDNPAIRSHDPIGPVVVATDFFTERLNSEKANAKSGIVKSLVLGDKASDDERQQLVTQGVFHRYE